MGEFLNYFGQVWYIILAALGVGGICVACGFAIKGVKVLLAKANITLSEDQLSVIKELVGKVVGWTNQKFVSLCKEKAENGKLTDEEASEAYNKSYTAIMGLLTEAQKTELAQKYGTIDDGIEIMIEAQIDANHVEAAKKTEKE